MVRKFAAFIGLYTLLSLGLVVEAQDYIPKFLKHTVKQGETPASIAARYRIATTGFLLLNDFPADVKLTPGQVVLIRQLRADESEAVNTPPTEVSKPQPVRSAEVNTQPAATAAGETKPVVNKVNTAPAATTSTEPKPVVTKADFTGPNGVKYAPTGNEYHVVQQGQTFYRIALINGLTVDELKALNNLSSTTIEVGQKLRVRK